MPKSRHNKTKRGTSRQRSIIHSRNQMESDSEMAMLLLLHLLARDGDDEAKSAIGRLVGGSDEMTSMVEAFDKVLDRKGFVLSGAKAV
jgi:hypothetical protein